MVIIEPHDCSCMNGCKYCRVGATSTRLYNNSPELIVYDSPTKRRRNETPRPRQPANRQERRRAAALERKGRKVY